MKTVTLFSLHVCHYETWFCLWMKNTAVLLSKKKQPNNNKQQQTELTIIVHVPMFVNFLRQLPIGFL